MKFQPPNDPVRIVELCQRAISTQTPKGMLPYRYGFKILHNVWEYMCGFNSASMGRLSWTAQWSRHYDCEVGNGK